MTPQQAKLFFTAFVRHVLETNGPREVTNIQLAEMMFKACCSKHIAGFCAAFAPSPCVCGLDICPERLSTAIALCVKYTSPAAITSAPNARTNETLH